MKECQMPLSSYILKSSHKPRENYCDPIWHVKKQTQRGQGHVHNHIAGNWQIGVSGDLGLPAVNFLHSRWVGGLWQHAQSTPCHEWTHWPPLLIAVGWSSSEAEAPWAADWHVGRWWFLGCWGRCAARLAGGGSAGMVHLWSTWSVIFNRLVLSSWVVVVTGIQEATMECKLQFRVLFVVLLTHLPVPH